MIWAERSSSLQSNTKARLFGTTGYLAPTAGMTTNRIGIIGGTGLGEYLRRETNGETVDIATPFGKPSTHPILARWEGADVIFLARHGEGHRFSPSNVPYRANIFALKKLGATAVIASGAVGSLREDIEPGHLVLCDQVIDRTFRRDNTFFDQDLAVHVEQADPFCPWLRKVLTAAAHGFPTTVHHAGTYICMEGPQFSTRAESHMHRQWGGDVIGMTCMPEAKLAREAELCYALVALPTDYDCWRPVDTTAPRTALLKEILSNLQRSTEAAVRLIREAIRKLDGVPRSCECDRSLQLAVWSDGADMDPAVRDRLEPLLRRYLTDKKP